ncbi:GEVED domain-containing protein [uncultured Winogradskyella sp.]|uniref:GEVED domain-containing protein n=1 Tax=uncultured Winogradskyella sp. TaxID=395353 RepID=UPI00262597F9|nr:GEVED domain-containing protein [uncultured Winogradskyella sp.]
MRKNTLNLITSVVFLISLYGYSQNDKSKQTLFGQDLTEANQQTLTENNVIRCASTEYENYLLQNNPNRQSTEEFENWLAPKIEALKAQRQESNFRVVQTIPVIFHIITDGTGPTNLDASYIQAQINQLNIDYGNNAGSSQGAAADTEIQFCLAQQNEEGNGLTENGINRITTYGAGPFTTNNFETSIKSATQWDPTKYFNVWVANLSGGVLGYAHWPESSGLIGVPGNNTGASNDGVVLLYSTLGSIALPQPGGAPYNRGRTLTHEAGHWLGLRHIWGDTGGCTNADYCADTPDATTSHANCGVFDTCPTDGLGNDMVENYMDYTVDTCMDTFTNDQKARMLAVLENSPRRVELVTSSACNPPIVYNLDAQLTIDNLGLQNCSDGSITPNLTITNKGTTTLTSATINYNLDGGANSTFNWVGSLATSQSATVTLPTTDTTIGSHVFNATLLNPNGSTDEQTGNNSVSESFEITGSLCSSVANTTFDTGTQGVIFNTISNLNTGKPSGYSDYTSISTEVNIDSSYDISVYIDTDGNFTCAATVWIDWNQNCSFDDEGEAYDLGTAFSNSNGLSGNSPLSITVPNTAVLGSTIMRVTTKYESAATPCENGHDAEVEDYTVIIQPSLSIVDNTLNSISIYPNPVTDKLIIKTINNDLPETYQVYSVLGQIVKEKTISNTNDLEINTSNFSSGLYFIKITKGNTSNILRFVKK